MLVTMSTVGYGDHVANTLAGRLLCGIAIVAGLVVISMALSLVGSNFTDAWEDRTLLLIAEKLRRIVEKERQNEEKEEREREDMQRGSGCGGKRSSLLGSIRRASVENLFRTWNRSKAAQRLTLDMRGFLVFDRHAEGSFNYKRFKTVVNGLLGLNLSSGTTYRSWKAIDTDDSGEVGG